MFLELTEVLRCPAAHDESYIICAPVTMDGRDVVRGGLACPVCRIEYAILDRVAWFSPPQPHVARAGMATGLTADAVHAFLALEGAGGFVITVGDAGRLGPALAALLPGIGVAGVNPPDDVAASAAFSVLRSPGAWPIRRHSIRAAVVGADAALDPWLPASISSLLNGLRVVIEDERAAPAGVIELARGAGVFVGEKRAR